MFLVNLIGYITAVRLIVLYFLLVGLYENHNATFWCMNIKNAEVSSSLFNNSAANEKR